MDEFAPTLISETEAPVPILDKTSADQGSQTTLSTNSKSGPVISSNKPRSQSITSKVHITSGTRLIRYMFKQDAKHTMLISATLDNSHGNSTVASPVYPFNV